MRVQLALEVLQFGFGAAVFELLPGLFGLVPAPRHPDGHAYGHDEQVEDYAKFTRFIREFDNDMLQTVMQSLVLKAADLSLIV